MGTTRSTGHQTGMMVMNGGEDSAGQRHTLEWKKKVLQSIIIIQTTQYQKRTRRLRVISSLQIRHFPAREHYLFFSCIFIVGTITEVAMSHSPLPNTPRCCLCLWLMRVHSLADPFPLLSSRPLIPSLL